MSDLEENLAKQIEYLGLPEPEREYRFHKPRRWRFDFAWPDRMLAVEVSGGIWTGGRHVTGRGATSDAEKLNEAQLAGWRVLVFTADMIHEGTALMAIERAMDG